MDNRQNQVKTIKLLDKITQCCTTDKEQKGKGAVNAMVVKVKIVGSVLTAKT